MRQDPLSQKIDWVTVLLFIALALLGWLNIYAVEYDPDLNQSIFDFGTSAGRQLVWIGTSLLIGWIVFFVDFRFFDSFALVIYGVLIAMLLFILVGGKEIAGSRSWLGYGGFGIQPSEFAKFATALALAKYLDHSSKKLTDIKTLVISFAIILLPLSLTILQGDTGTALVFGALIIPMFREGLPPLLPIVALGVALIFFLTLLLNQTVLLVIVGIVVLLGVGINAKRPRAMGWILIVGFLVVGMVRSVDFVLTDVLKPHQQKTYYVSGKSKY